MLLTSKPVGFMQSCPRWLPLVWFTRPSIVVTSQINSPDPGKYLPELPNFMQYYTWCHAHIVRARHPCTSSTHRPHVVCASSARHPCVICACSYVVRTRTHHLHIIYTSSALLPMVSMGLNYLLLWQEFIIEWNLWQECWIVPFQDYVNDLQDNLCCWFSLHVKSGHCSHIICICTCHLHIIWAYAYYAHIICSGPWYLPS